jgi:aerobic-type carbon monoxide dehydrogenase small subunit (CoxS/CutS family)
MKQTIRVTINGRLYEEDVEPRLLLSHFLRENIGLTGTHVGCVVGECGACSVLLDGKVVKSCLHFAVQADGREVTTVEGLAKDSELSPMRV